MSSYQVIARKYRPQRFSDVVGQEHVTQTLSHAIETGRIAHAYLFCGPRGTGKTTIARIFAMCLNSTGGPKADFAPDDPKALEISEGRSLDVLEIDGASNRGIDEIRDLRETVKYAPASSKFKIYIIDEVHMLTKEAFNALLKTLEEPPSHVKFMFATTEPEKVLATILSRCQRFDLRRIPINLMVDHLKHIAKQESVEIDDAALFAIARGADGGMRDAESALDQLISFCGNKIVEADVLSMFGLTSQSQLLALSNAMLKGDADAVLREFNDLTKHGKDLGKFVADLLQHLRNLLVFQISNGDTRLLELSEAEANTMAEQSSLVNTDALTRMMEVLTNAEASLRDAASRKIFIEIALIKAIDARNAVSIDAVLKRLNDLRGGDTGVTASVVAPSAPRPAAALPSAPVRPPSAAVTPARVAQTETPTMRDAPAGVATGTVELQALWPQLMAAIRRANAFAYSYFMDSHPVSFSNNVLTIGFDPEFEDKIGLANNSRNHTLIATKLAELGVHGAQVKIIKAERPEGFTSIAPAAEPAPEPARPAVVAQQLAAPVASSPAKAPAPPPPAKPVQLDPAEFKDDPLIKKALEVFKGTIVEVRA
jgi:DNA polymerase III subunit gamma/tau